jgi:hypothetical protein
MRLCAGRSGITLDILYVARRAADHSANIGSNDGVGSIRSCGQSTASAKPCPASVSYQLIKVLASEGAVTPSEADSLRNAIGLRNAATHGQFSVPITEEEDDQVVAAAKLVRCLVTAPSPP